MKKIGFIIPTYPDEKRVCILPEHVSTIMDKCVFEKGFGHYLDIPDSEYIKVGAEIDTKKNIFDKCDYIFSLKLIQPEDYKYINQNQKIIGWTHPLGSGNKFFKTQGKEKDLQIVDLDNIYPRLYTQEKTYDLAFLSKNFIYKNSINAGIASVMHAFLSMGILPNSKYKIAVLGNGNVSQGAFSFLSKFNAEIRMFYRKTMDEFQKEISTFDIIVNGIEIDDPNKSIISYEQKLNLKKGCLVIDAAADVGNAIQGTHFSTVEEPIYCVNNIYYYAINNSPSLLYRKASFDISEALSNNIFNEDCSRLFNF